jgi:hypothetical protein
MSPARAEETAPADTAAYVSYCEDSDHFNTCRLTVVNVNNRTLIKLINHQHGCIIPNELGENTRARSGVATKAILAHLKTAVASPPPKTDDAILFSIKTLWPEKCE